MPELRRPRLLSAALTFVLLTADPAAAQDSVTVTDVIGHLSLTDFNNNIASNPFKDWGNEPFIAVNPLNPNEQVVSSFAFSSTAGGGRASIWYSTDRGNSWSLRFPITQSPGGSVPNDQNFVFDGGGKLHTVMLAGSSDSIVYGSTIDPNRDGFGSRTPNPWTWYPNTINSSGQFSDQPWLAVRGSGSTARVFVAYDNFNSGFFAVEERVAVSTNGGSSFSTSVPVSRGGQVNIFTNPGLRITADATSDKVYAIFGIAQTGNTTTGIQNVDYRLNQSIDGGLTWRNTNSTAVPGGLAIDSGRSSQGNGSSFGGKNQLRGNTTAIAVDATGSHVYTVYGKRDATNTDRLFLAEFHPSDPLDTTSSLVMRPLPVAFSPAGDAAALPSITVTDNGTVVVMYDTFSTADNRYHIHMSFSADQGLTFVDQDIYSFDPSFITLGTNGFNDSRRALGDFQYLMSIGDEVFGTFAGRGNVNAGGINTTGMITPFYVNAVVPVPEPSVFLLTAFGLCAANAAFRRRRPPVKV